MDAAVVFSSLASLMHFIAGFLYCRTMVRPNPASWLLWIPLSALNAATYVAMTGDVVKGFVPIASALLDIIVFAAALKRGRFNRLTPFDVGTLVTGGLVAFVWWHFKNATYANLLLQAWLAVAFVPTLRQAWRDPASEAALPWLIWGSSYVFSFMVLALRWRGQPLDLVYPINCMLLQLGVGLLALRKRSVRT